MRCEHCIALKNDGGYEHDAEEYWCAVGEEEIEFTDGTLGCRRRSVEKLKRDMKVANELECEAFAEECGRFLDFLASEEADSSLNQLDNNT